MHHQHAGRLTAKVPASQRIGVSRHNRPCMACAGFTGFTRGCRGTCTLLGVFHPLCLCFASLLASISILLYIYILFGLFVWSVLFFSFVLFVCACRSRWGPCMSHEALPGHSCNLPSFLRSILGVRTGTPNAAVLGELGRFPVAARRPSGVQRRTAAIYTATAALLLSLDPVCSGFGRGRSRLASGISSQRRLATVSRHPQPSYLPADAHLSDRVALSACAAASATQFHHCQLAAAAACRTYRLGSLPRVAAASAAAIVSHSGTADLP